MKESTKRPTRSAGSTKQRFTRAHEVVLSGLVASEMSIQNCFKVIMSLKTEKQATSMAVWMYRHVTEHDEFPSHQEMMRKAKAKPFR